jgi:hypothetical protein
MLLELRREGEITVSPGEIFMVVMFLMVFVAVPIIFAQCGRRRPAGLANLQVCPDCGAHNYKTKERCYCCGYRFIHPRSDEAAPVQIQEAQQEDGRRAGRGREPAGLQEVAVTLLRTNKAGRS